MAPVSLATRASARRLFGVIPAVLHHARYSTSGSTSLHKREGGIQSSTDIVFAVLIPVLVLLSGVFAGLTLGYMSLDDTQLHVLSISGTPKQREYANKIKPIRKNGHLLLVTLLLANMIVNETLPIISERVLGGGIQSVVISTVLIIIFAEIIPQSICTRYGLYIGAKMAGPTQILIYIFGIVSYPVAKLLEFMLGAHHGIIYRRTELKELIAMHSNMATHGGDLKDDTVNIIGATLDLQEKDVRQAMTPIADVFMLSIDATLDYDLLRQIVKTGHSRVPIYEEVTIKRVGVCKRIVGIMLVKQLILLDPQSSIPIRRLTLNHVPFIPSNMPLLGILDRFQEGRSHMAIVSRISVEKAASVKIEVKRGLTRRLKDRVGMTGETASTSSSSDEDEEEKTGTDKEKKEKKEKTNPGLQLPLVGLEQSMPADAVLAKAGAEEFLQGVDPAIMPLGIITLEDVLEELIGEEIYDEFDSDGAHHGGVNSYDPVALAAAEKEHKATSSPVVPSHTPSGTHTPTDSPRPNALKNLSFLRPRSTPPRPVTAPPGDLPTVIVHGAADEKEKEVTDAATKKHEGPLPDTKTKLEAILLDRQRRLGVNPPAGAPAAVIHSPIPRAPGGHIKGGKFKSSPLQGTLEAPKEPEKLESVQEVKTPDQAIPNPLNPKGPDKDQASGAGL